MANLNDNFKPGDRVRITGNNQGRPGGIINGHIGRVYTLQKWHDSPYHRRKDNGVPGYWKMEEVEWIWNATEFVLAEEKAVVKEKEVNLQDMLYKDLYKMAVEKNLPMRSAMNKQALISALQNKPEKAAVAKGFTFGEEFVKRCGVGNPYGCCHFAYEFDNGSAENHINAACYAGLNRASANIKYMWIDVSSHARTHKDLEAYKKWVNYVLSESSVADVFDVKTFDDAMKHAVRIDARKVSISKIAVAATMLRGGSEFPYMATSFTKLLDMGIPSKIAFVIANNFTYEGEKFLFSPLNGAHQWFNFGDTNWDDFVKFINAGFHINSVLKEPPFSDMPRGRYLMQDAVAKRELKDKDTCKVVFKEICGLKERKNPGEWYASIQPLTEKEMLNAAFKLTKYFPL